MLAKPIGLEEIGVFRGLPVKFALIAGLAGLMPGIARAQVNIDAGKSAAEIYASDCATCHKTPRGLAAGKNSLMLSSFLREHYTASPDQASALAAYVLGAGGAEPAPKQKPDVEHARAEEAKPGEPKTAGAKTSEVKPSEVKPGQPKTAAHPVRAASKPEEKRVKDEEAKREQHPAPATTEEREPETASREQTRQPEEAAPAAREATPASAASVPHQTPATAVAPSTPSTATASVAAVDGSRSNLPSLELGSSLSAKPPAEDQSSAASVPRDNIPD
jgi:outer membrane biosynthesis protein TonB